MFLAQPFYLSFSTGESVLSSAHVTVLVTDANDNVPIFEQKVYEFTVTEDAKAGELMGECFQIGFKRD